MRIVKVFFVQIVKVFVDYLLYYKWILFFFLQFFGQFYYHFFLYFLEFTLTRLHGLRILRKI